MTLTEQLKKGKLKSGYYYIVTKHIEFPNRIDFYNSSAAAWSYHSNIFIEEVLAPVPSYEELQELSNKYDSLQERLFAQAPIHLENQQLKELLKRCRDFINYEVPDHCIDDVLLDKIDEVLK